jgi:DNA-binding NarL/FixJ family response regulator
MDGTLEATGSTMYAVVLCEADAAPEISTFLEAGGVAQSTQVGTAAALLSQAEETMPDLVLVDFDCPAAMGLVVCTSLRERHGDLLPIVVVSAKWVSSEDQVAGLLLGADEYLVKPLDRMEAVARLRRLVRRAAAQARQAKSKPEPVRHAAGNLDQYGLTRREVEVLDLLIAGLSDMEMARELTISPSTVAAHTQRILRKLGARNRVQAVVRAVESGRAAATHGSSEGATAGPLTHSEPSV